jgi:hypothetical protein
LNEGAANVPSPIGPAWRHAGIAALVACGVCFLVWMPFVGRLDLFARHFDGPCYMVVAKTFYRPTAVNPLPGYIVQPAYYTIHFPVFPAGIRAFATIFGYPGGMLAATLLFAVASAAAFDLYARKVVPEVAPLVALLAFLLIPSRHTLFRALGSAEGAFALFLLLAVWAFHEERYGLAFAAAGLSAVTRINGLLVIAVLALVLLERRRFRWAFGGAAAALVPFGALCLWFWHLYRSPFQFLAVHASKRTPFPFAEIAEKIREGNWEGAELLVAFVVMMALGAARLWTMKLPVESLLVLSHIVLFALLRESNVVRWASPFAPFFLVVAWRELWRERRVAGLTLVGLGALSIVVSWQSVEQDLLSEPVYHHLLRFLAS